MHQYCESLFDVVRHPKNMRFESSACQPLQSATFELTYYRIVKRLWNTRGWDIQSRFAQVF